MTARSTFTHAVQKTHRYQEMINWYVDVFEASMNGIVFRCDRDPVPLAGPSS